MDNKKFQQQHDIEDVYNNFEYNPYSQYDKYFDDESRKLRLSLPWIILTIGLFGNIVILIIFTQKLRRRNSNAFCFCALAVSDMLALIFMLFRAMLKAELLSNFNVTCKVIKFLYHFFLQTSSWCLVLLTIDRFIAVMFVFKYQTWCKKLHVIKLFIVLIVAILLINMHLLIFVDAFERQSKPQSAFQLDGLPRSITARNDTSRLANVINRLTTTTRRMKTPNVTLKKSLVCNVSYEKYPFYYDYIYSQWDIYHACIYGAIPFIIIFVCNCMIIYKLVKRHYKTAKFKTVGTTAAPGADPLIKSFQLTVMLLTIAFTFLFLTSPISIYMAFIYDRLPYIRISKREFIKVLLRYLGYLNNAINFYIYFATSNEFRHEVANLFRSCLPGSASSIYTACTSSTSVPDVNVELKPFKKKREVIVKPMDQRISEYERGEEVDDSKRMQRYDMNRDGGNRYEIKTFLEDNGNVKITPV